MTTSLVAQHKKHMSHEEYCKKLQTFITDYAKLTSEESDKFFPLYFELQKEKWKINKEARYAIKGKTKERPTTPPTDEEFKKLVNEMSDAKIEIAKLEKNYIEKYLKILPAKKILDVQRAEEKFQREMIKKMARGMQKKETPNN